jgi:hypothetical protein
VALGLSVAAHIRITRSNRPVVRKEIVMTDRTMYDSTSLDAIPADAEIVAFYPFAFPGDISRFEKAVFVRIDNDGEHPAECSVLDVETGAASVADAPLWLEAREESGAPRGTLYCNLTTLPVLLKAVKGQKFDLWIANPTGEQHKYDAGDAVNVVATQWAWPGIGSDGHYDISYVTDDNWHPSKEPVAPPAPAPSLSVSGVVTFVNPASNGLAQKQVKTEDQKTWTVV